jgi:hypothetical protein
MGNIQVSKLNNTVAEKSLIAEAKSNATYSTMKRNDNKSRVVDTSRPTTRKATKIPQIEVPVSMKMKKSSSRKGKGASGIPQAERADKIVDKNKVARPSAAKKTSSNNKIKVSQAGTPSTSPKTRQIKKPKSIGSDAKSNFPSADYAGNYVDKMSKGSSNLGASGKSKKATKPQKAQSLKATTRPVSKVVDISKRAPVGKPTAVKKPTKQKRSSTQSWRTDARGINVIESVQFIINGKPKASFGIINTDVANKLVESYQKFGFDVELRRGEAEWKRDTVLLRTIYESIDAKYNNAGETSIRTRNKAMNRFFNISRRDYNNLYESKQQFAQTVKTAFNHIMKKADSKYRGSLQVCEGMARINFKNEIIDIDIITQAHSTDMALRNFRNEILEEYGFNTDIKHIFIDGKKYLPKQIKDWTLQTKL